MQNLPVAVTTQSRTQKSCGCVAGGASSKQSTLMSQLVRVQQLATTWLSIPNRHLPSTSGAEGPLTEVERLPAAGQVCCMLQRRRAFAQHL